MGQAESKNSATPREIPKKQRKRDLLKLAKKSKSASSISYQPIPPPPPQPLETSSSSSSAISTSNNDNHAYEPSTNRSLSRSMPPLSQPLRFQPKLTRTTSTPNADGKFLMKESSLRETLEDMGFSRAVISDVLEGMKTPELGSQQPNTTTQSKRRTIIEPNSLIQQLMEETRKRFGDLAVEELTNPSVDEPVTSILSSPPADQPPRSKSAPATPYINPFSEDGARDEDDDNTCKVCLDRPIDTVILRCGHLAVCSGCSVNLQLCPICRSTITEIVRIYHA